MTTSEERRRLLENLECKEFRDALVEADLANGILFQIRAMLEDRGWTQEELAEKAGTSQPVISKYLKGYENFSIKTLLKLASAFDVSFTNRFERFSDLANRHLDVDRASLTIPDYPNDAALRAPVSEYSLASAALLPSSFVAGSFSAEISMNPTAALDLAIAGAGLGSPEVRLEPFFEAKTPRQREEEAYANAA